MSGSPSPGGSRWRALLAFGVLQGLGSVATLACTLLLAWTQGPVVQGNFNAIKAQVDFLTALSTVGLPQAFFYAIHNGSLAKELAFRVAGAHCAIATVLLTGWFTVSQLGSAGSPGSHWAALSVAVTVGVAVLYTILRGAVLAYRSTMLFSLLSVAPSILLLLFVAFSQVVSFPIGENRMATIGVFGLTYLLAAAFAVWASLWKTDFSASRSAGSILRLYRYGIATWLPAVAQSASVYFVLHWLGERVGDKPAVGAFSAGLAVVAISVSPLTLAAPMLFKQWAGSHAASRNREFVQMAAWFTGAALVAWILVIAFDRQLVGFLFGSEYLPYARSIGLLALAIPAQGAMKLWGVVLSAEGRPDTAVAVESVRFGLIASGTFLFGTDLDAIVFVWIVSECVTLALAIVLARRRVARASSAAPW